MGERGGGYGGEEVEDGRGWGRGRRGEGGEGVEEEGRVLRERRGWDGDGSACRGWSERRTRNYTYRSILDGFFCSYWTVFLKLILMSVSFDEHFHFEVKICLRPTGKSCCTSTASRPTTPL